MRRIINALTAFLMLSTVGLSGQNNFFEVLTSRGLPPAVEVTKNIKSITIVRLNEQAMRTYLLNAPLEFHNNGMTLPLEIPLPNGKTETFGMVESPILSPEVAAQNPEIKTYTGNGLTNKKSIIRLSLTSEGFNAILLNVEGDAVYFEKYSKQAQDLYFTYFTHDVLVPGSGEKNKTCEVGLLDEMPKHTGAPSNESPEKMMPVATVVLKTFRLAMAANGEFTAQHGGTQAGAFAAVVGYVNRMTAFYRNELGVNFTLVSGTNLVYTNAGTDPYDNNDQVLMLDQNLANCNAVIGAANYDIGHVWGYVGSSGGGIAAFEAVCDDTRKGSGVSGEGDLSFYAQVFMDQLVFHEVGHQFGMSHSYNSSIPVCTTRNPGTSVEPGAGATVMSYGFTCDTDDYFTTGIPFTGPILQFHAANLVQANAYMANPTPGYGNCYTPTVTTNEPPVVTVPGSYTIPKSTPFTLTGSATDANSDALTYCWEGMNIGTETPNASTLADLTKPPFFRTYGIPDSSGPTRIYPLLAKILDGTNYAKGDKLPSIGIVTNHRFTVRDNNSQGGGVTFADVAVTVNGAIGPFLETTNLGGSYAGLSTQTITWSVNGTNVATPNVKISLSTDGGLTFPTVLLASTPNDGSQSVTLPNTATTMARIKVEAVGNIFFDISNVNFTITTVAGVTCPSDFAVCVSAPPFDLTGGMPAGGTYSGTGVSAGVFNPATAGVGMHTITYTNGGSCTFVITVNALPVVTCPGNSTANSTDPAFALMGGAPAGGTYSGTGVSGGMFNPATAGVGMHTITYSYTDGNGCTNTCSFTITVNAPMATCPGNSAVCINAPAFALTGGMPTGGTYSGTGVSGGMFNPATAGVGMHTITYTNGGSCTFTITVNPKPDPSITGPTTVCNGGSVTLDAGAGYATYAWSNGGGSGQMATFSNITGTTTYSVTVTNGSGCTGTASITIEIGAGFPQGWSAGDIGTNANGSSEYAGCGGGNENTFTLSAQGYTTNTTDVQHTVYQTLCGNAEIVAHVASIAPNGGWAGVQMRETSSQGSKKFTLKTQLQTILRREIRTTTFGPTNTLQSVIPPTHTWLRLVRAGSTFSAYSSSDGVNWTFRSAATIAMNSCIQVGLFVESFNNTTTTTAAFNNVSFSGGAPAPIVVVPDTQGGLVEAIDLMEVNLYPNPTNDKVTLEFQKVPVAAEFIRCTLYDAQGIAVMYQQFAGDAQQETLNLSALANGVYWVRIQTDSMAPVISKVIKR